MFGSAFLKRIHRSVSADDSVEVSETDGIRSLHLGNATVQSSMRLQDPSALELSYTRGMMAFLLFAPDATNILMIGLGGGSIAKYIHKYLPRVSARVIEINPRIIQIARSHFQVPENDDRLTIIEGDGAAYVKEQAAAAQVIMVDAFDSIGIPADLCSQSFFDHCYQALTQDGIFVMNLWGSDRNFDAYLLRIEQAFEQRVLILPTGKPGNIVVFGFRRMPSEMRWDELRKRARQLAQEHQLELLQFVEKIQDSNAGTPHRLTLGSGS